MGKTTNLNLCRSSPIDSVVYTVEKVDGANPKRWPSKQRGYDKPIHGSCAIYFPGWYNLVCLWFCFITIVAFSEFMVTTKISPGCHQFFCVTKCPNHKLHSQPSPSLAHSYYTIPLEQFYNCSAGNFQTHLISNKKNMTCSRCWIQILYYTHETRKFSMCDD